MPSSITVLMVDLDKLQKVFGSKNKKLVKAILDEHDIADDDTDVDDFEEAEEGDEDIDLDDLDGLPSSQDALRHIIMGEPWAKGIGSKYGYAFMTICEHLGEQLDAPSWCETRADYLHEFDKVLGKVGVPASVVSMQALAGATDLFPLPPRSDFPFIGTLSPEEVAAAATGLAAVDRKALEKASNKVKISRGAIEPAFVMASFDELRQWCETCTANKKGLILFYY